ncbi:MAG: signal recognition particle receptor subunit alpha, partial [Chloroflexi bacterium]|nr:signal recognition particle receptor subunit alpha [Chloroflexota bacterium]
MFEALTEKLTSAFARLARKGRITEQDVDEALREVRRALLEADVHFQVVRDLLARVRERSLGAQVLESVTPAQQVVKIVHEELTALLGKEHRALESRGRSPAPVLLIGLQGSGKTTTAAKLALYLKGQGQSALLAAGDLRRPAAVEQLVTLGRQVGVPVYTEPVTSTPAAVARHALAEAQRQNARWLLVDTGGRLHIDAELMEELAQVRAALDPVETLRVLDDMTGQDAVRATQEFHRQVPLTGLI